jgi:hypothetical protein
MRHVLTLGLTVGILSGFAVGAGAQQSGSTSPQPGAGGERVVTIDCPPSAAAAPSGGTAGASAGGTTGQSGATGGSATGKSAGKAATKRVDGTVSKVDPGGKTLTVAGVALQLDPQTVVLVECKQATLSAVKDGATAKAAYEDRNGQNVVTVIEATVVTR